MSTLAIILLMLFPIQILAQQNFFNVPSSNITEKDHLFIQEQVNTALKDLLSSNTTLSYGLGRGFELGVNVFNLDRKLKNPLLSCNTGEDQPYVLFNGQKVFKLNKDLDLGLGTQMGGRLAHGTQLSYFHYINFGYEFPKSDIRVTLGGYVANKAFKGDGDGLIMMGLEVPILKKKLHIVADYISGDSKISATVIGVSYYANQKLNLSLGCQLPTQGHDKSMMVIEVTLYPGKILHKKK